MDCLAIAGRPAHIKRAKAKEDTDFIKTSEWSSLMQYPSADEMHLTAGEVFKA
jgi:hypothetical protein